MREKLRLQLSKLLALLAVFLLVYPGVLILRISLYKEDGGLIGSALAIVLVALAYFISTGVLKKESQIAEKIAANPVSDFLFDGKVNKSLLSQIISYSTLVIPIIIALTVYFSKGILRLLLEAPASFILYFIGLRANIIRPENLLNGRKAYTGIFFFGSYVFVAYYFEDFTYLKPMFIAFACGFMVISLWIQNQANLDNVFARKEQNATYVPQNLRKYNTVMILLFFVCVILIFNLKSITVFLLGIARAVVRTAIYIILWIIDFLMPGGGQVQQKQPRAGYPFQGDLGAQINHPIWGLIYNTIGYFILLYTIYKLSPFLFKKLKQLFAWIAMMVRKFLKGFNKAEEQKNEDYNDEIETIKPPDSEKENRNLRRKYNNFRRNLKKIDDPVEKVRYIYGAILYTLMSRSMGIRSSDTTWEIFGKTLSIDGMEVHFKEITRTYNRVRYGDSVPGMDEVRKAEDGYIKVNEVLKKR